MIGGPVGFGVGVPFVASTAVVQLGAFHADGAALALLTGQSTAAAGSVIIGSAPVSFAGGSIAHFAFGLSGNAALVAAGRARAHVVFDIDATSDFDFRNVPLLAGWITITGSSSPTLISAFSVLPAKEAMPRIEAGRGQTGLAGGQADTSARGGMARKTIAGGRSKTAVGGGSARKSITL